MALFLSALTENGLKVSEWKQRLPEYQISKNRIDLTPDTDVDAILDSIKTLYKDEHIDTRDGVKIDFEEGWVHLRKSNTEPIIRVYSEAATMLRADQLAGQIIDRVHALMQQ